MLSDIVFIGILSFFLSLVLSAGVLHCFPSWGLLDFPERYGHKRAPIPYPGGVAPVLSWLLVVLLLLLFGSSSAPVWYVWLACIPLVVVSFWDDRRGVPALFRLFVQVFCASLVVWGGAMLDFVRIPGLPETVSLLNTFGPWFAGALSVGWIVVATNVFNWLDGVPGLASHIAVVSGVFLAALSLSAGVDQPELARLSIALAGSAAAFMILNLSPPLALLGDTASMFYGFLLASFSILFGGKVATAFLVMALPLADASYVLFRRILDRQSPLKGGDKRHLHDRLMQLGVPERMIVLGYTSVSVLLGYLALQLQTQGKVYLFALTLLTFWCCAFWAERSVLSSARS